MFTHSVHGTECAGKYGPHGELFFLFLIQEEPAIAPNSETFSPFINPDIRTPLFSADVLKKCALLALHMKAEEERDGDGFQVPELGGEGERSCLSFPAGLGVGKGGIELPHGPGHAVPGNA